METEKDWLSVYLINKLFIIYGISLGHPPPTLLTEVRVMPLHCYTVGYKKKLYPTQKHMLKSRNWNSNDLYDDRRKKCTQLCSTEYNNN